MKVLLGTGLKPQGTLETFLVRFDSEVHFSPFLSLLLQFPPRSFTAVGFHGSCHTCVTANLGDFPPLSPTSLLDLTVSIPHSHIATSGSCLFVVMQN